MGKQLSDVEYTFYFCDGGSCKKAGSEYVVREARKYLRNNALWKKTHSIKTRCNGRCEDAPTCIVQEGNYWYKNVDPEQIVAIIESHLFKKQPSQDNLLFQNNWNAVASDNERAGVKAKPFAQAEEAQLGKILKTRGFSSDQYLYPLFAYLQEYKVEADLEYFSGNSYAIQSLTKVVYQEEREMELHFKDGKTLNLMIGPLGANPLPEWGHQKITVTEYIESIESGNKYIRFKNKQGKLVALLKIAADATQFWEYCLEVQLDLVCRQK